MVWSVVLLVDFWWSPYNFVMSHFNVMLLKSQECMYVYVSIVVPIYLCMQLHWAGSPGLFTQLLKASRQARSQEWRCGDVEFLLLNFGGLMMT